MEGHTIGAIVREARKEAGLAQRELARRAGIAYATLQSIEAEARRTTPGNLAQVLETLFDSFADRQDARALLEAYGGSAQYADAVLSHISRHEQFRRDFERSLQGLAEYIREKKADREELKKDIDALAAEDVPIAARILRAMIETKPKA